MKNGIKVFLSAALVLIISHSTFSQDIDWPRTWTNQGSTLVTYQPQADSWDDFTSLTFRQAFELTPSKGEDPVVGVLSIEAATEVNTYEHAVLISDLKVEHISFPSVDSATSIGLAKIVRSFIPDTVVMSLEQVVACVPKKEVANTVQVQNNPPVIFVSHKPAILLQLDGKAVMADITNTSLSFAINANWPLFLDQKKTIYYLFDETEWLTSTKLEGPWRITSTLPSEMNDLVKDTTWASLKNAIPPPKSSNKTVPKVFYSDKLAELIVFKGSPAFKKISDLSLQYASNTESDIFMDSKDKKYYCLLGGRWFRSASLDGPWSYASTDLPADFAKIPYSSPAARVLASVPGTEEAKDAVMIAQIPTSIVVDPKTAPENVKINYNGEPNFEPIEGTSMTYATNTPDKVIIVDKLYYACYQGIWFVSSSPNGPWQTATTVPEVIYTIPSSSPVYNVTYVTQTVTPDGYVTASYTSGYTGTYVVSSSTTVIIVSGTGYYHPPIYYYPPYGYPRYYPYPPPYGYGYPAYGHRPYPTTYRAGYNPSTGTYARSATAYGPYGKATAGQAYNPYTGTAARGVSTTTPYGRNSYGQAYNARTGTYAQTQQHSNAKGQWGSSTVSNKYGQSASAGHVTTKRGTAGAVKTSGGDVYAGKDGNVYKKTNNGWQQAGGTQPKQGTKPANTQRNQAKATQAKTTQTQASQKPRQSAGRQPAASQSRPANSGARPQTGSSQTQDLNRQAQDRQRGNHQSQQFRSGANRGGAGYGGGAAGRSGGVGRRR